MQMTSGARIAPLQPTKNHFFERLKKLFVLLFCFILSKHDYAQVTFEKNYINKGFANSNTIFQSPQILNACDSGYYLFTWNGDSSNKFTNNLWLSISRINKKGQLMW